MSNKINYINKFLDLILGRTKARSMFVWGFTIIELITVVSIFTVITTVIMFRFSSFNNRILTTNLAYDIALSIRQAQTFGINVRGFDVGGGTTFDAGYGIHFDVFSTNTYTFFADINDNKRFDTGEEIDIFTLGGGHVIEKFCGITAGPTTSCSDSSPEFNELDIVFKRPDPDAVIGRKNPPTVFQSGYVRILSPTGTRRDIEVYSTGQISVVEN